jgi:hypothetical protein
VPDDWSVQVTTGTPSPSIVITNERHQNIDQLSIGILSQKSLEICDIKVFTDSDLRRFFILFFTMITLELTATVFIVFMIHKFAPIGQRNRTCWIESSNAQGG